MAMQEPKELPRKARILGYLLEPTEKLLLLAIDEHCDGNTLTASKDRLAAYTGLSIKQVRRLFNGYLPVAEGKGSQEQREARTQAARMAWRAGKRTGDAAEYKPGFLDRKILIQTGKGGWKRGMNVSSTYQINESALKECPQVKAYRELDKQRALPGFREPAAPGHPIYLEKPGSSPSGRGRVTMTPHPPSQPDMPTSDGTQTGDGRVTMTEQYGHSDRGEAQKGTVTMTGGRVTMTDDPSTICITNTVSIYDDDVVSLNFAELQKGLREIIPALDDRAIHQIVSESRKRASDCTAQEIVYFAWTKADALKKANNPVGLLIHAVPQCFEGTLLKSYRETQRKAEEGQRIREAHKAEAERCEKEELDQWKENMRREEEEIDRHLAEIDSLPKEEFQKLASDAERIGGLAPYRRTIGPVEFEKQLRRMMAKLRMQGAFAPTTRDEYEKQTTCLRAGRRRFKPPPAT